MANCGVCKLSLSPAMGPTVHDKEYGKIHRGCSVWLNDRRWEQKQREANAGPAEHWVKEAGL
jgi:hypothetical protein